MFRRLLVGYHVVEGWFDLLRSPALLVFRIWVFWQLLQTGIGKLQHIGKIADFFAQLNIPFPLANAWFIGCLETFGSALIIVGLFSRLVAIPLTISMIVAYIAADMEAWSSFLTNPDKFEKADPFIFLLAALAILIFGPGKFSLDYLLSFVGKRRPKEA
jgi:putative oxidoreductase